MKATLPSVILFLLLSLRFHAHSQTYCIPPTDIGCAQNDVITSFELGSISNVSGNTCNASPAAFSNYTAISTNLVAGATHTATVRIGGGGSGMVAIWIDYNNNGIFETTEQYAATTATPGNGTVYIPISVPASAPLGSHRMRVREAYGASYFNLGPCDFSVYGETEDYKVNIINTPCSALSVATLTASANNACSGKPFSLTATPSGLAGYLYQFQASTDGGTTWNNLGAATSDNVFVVSSQNVSTHYRVLVSCSGGSAVTSAPVLVTQSFLACYCTTDLGGSGNATIDSVSIPGTSLENAAPGQGIAFYTAFPATGNTTATLVQGNTYQIHGAFGSNVMASMWIDYNHNGVFDPEEHTQLVLNANNGTASFTVPMTALTGQTGMRMRSRGVNSWNGPGSACTDFYVSGGETEDYIITINPAPPCSSNPIVAMISSSADSICPGAGFALSTVGTNLSGLTFQFQVSVDGGTTWTDLGNATSSTSYSIPAQSSTSQYRVIAMCDGGVDDTSAAITVVLKPNFLCYCSTGLGGSALRSIDTVIISGTTLYNATPGAAPGFYTAYPATGNTTATLAQGAAYDIHTAFGGGNARASLWIDYNKNGMFEASEHTQITTNASSATASFAVPLTALTGPTGMRMRSNAYNQANGPADACTQFYAGETEDYIIIIAAAPPCSGVPAAGIIASVSSVCAGTPFTLTATPGDVAGLTFQFQKSADGGATWVDLGLPTALPFYALYSQSATSLYRVLVSCAGGSTGTSLPITVTQNQQADCYCVPVYTTGCSDDDYIALFELGAMSNFSGAACNNDPKGYQDYTAISISVIPGNTYYGSYTIGPSGPGGIAIWIDYNDNLIFEPTEKVYSTGMISGGSSGAMYIPITPTAALGTHRMRVRQVWGISGTIIDPCASYDYGETEDYTVHVMNQPCNGVFTATITSDDGGICAGTPFTLTASPSGATGLTYQFQVSTDEGATWNNMGAETENSTFTIASQTVASRYRVLITCPGNLPVISNEKSINQNNFEYCYCHPPATIATDNYITHVGFSSIYNSSGATEGGYADYTYIPSSPTLQKGMSHPISVSVHQTAGASVGVWIDFDHSGTFDPNEFTNLSGGITTLNTVTGNIQVPANAQSGWTRMRVRTQHGADLLPTDACNDLPAGLNNGETEDYRVSIEGGPDCNGAPVATLLASETVICPYTPFLLTAGPTGVSNVTYQYQASIDGGLTWSNLDAAIPFHEYMVTNQALASQYRVVVTCLGSGNTSTSTPVTVAQYDAEMCLCFPTFTLDCNTGNHNINDFVLPGEDGSGINHLSSGCSEYGYGVFDNMSVGMHPGSTYSGTMTTGGSGHEHYVIWIDLNDNGFFESFEKLASGGPASNAAPVAFSLTIPENTLTSTVRMRVRLIHDPLDTVNIDPCSPYSFGETHDYSVNIYPICANTVVDLGADTGICPNMGLILNAGFHPAATYAWSTGEATQKINIYDPGTYSVTITRGDCVVSDTIVIGTMPPAEAGAIVVSGDAPTLTFSTTGFSLANTYTWLFGDGESDTGTLVTHTYASEGNYTVLLLAGNVCGDVSTASTEVIIADLSVEGAPKTDKGQAVQVYPNPSRGITVIAAERQVILGLELVDPLGRSLMRAHPKASKTTVDVKGLSQGVYTIHIHTDKGRSAVKLVVGDK